MRLRGMTAGFCLVGVALAGGASDCRGALALDFSGGTLGTPVTSQTLGWQFTLTAPQLLTSLGMIDAGATGLSQAHVVNVWAVAGGTPLASVSVSNAGQAVPSMQVGAQWIFQNLASPQILPAGTYVIGADYAVGSSSPNVDLVYTSGNNAFAITLASGVVFDGLRFTTTTTPGVDFPDAFLPGSLGQFGPSLMLSAVPEPAGLSVLACTLPMLSRRRRLR